jgi:ABC-type Na+ transport system ATPase subunit NatA
MPYTTHIMTRCRYVFDAYETGFDIFTLNTLHQIKKATRPPNTSVTVTTYQNPETSRSMKLKHVVFSILDIS